MQIIEITADNLLNTVELMKKEYDMLVSIGGVDKLEYYEVVYHFISTTSNKAVALKVKLEKNNAEVESLSGLYSAANWHEREVYDLFGIEFRNHPNLTRILLPNDWKGYPLRKNYVNNDERLCWNER